jgi:site-specific DNA-methyltransferase (adenine-specific)
MKLFNDDCLKVLPTIPDKSIDLILTDPPYGTTACKWDSVIPFEPMWKELKRIIKDNSAIVFTASQPFTSSLVMSNVKMFKYEWIWEKAVGSNFATLKYQPMKEHENILVFSKGTHKYFPIKEKRKGSGSQRVNYGHSGGKTGESGGSIKFKGFDSCTYDKELRNPSTVQYFNNRESSRGLHPTQKPIALLEYLIKTYTNEGDTVLDFTMGSGSTGVACKNLNRDFIGIELDQEYFKIAKQRIESTTSKSINNYLILI